MHDKIRWLNALPRVEPSDATAEVKNKIAMVKLMTVHKLIYILEPNLVKSSCLCRQQCDMLKIGTEFALPVA